METHKRCASCAMEIPFEARKCGHCRAFQPGAARIWRDPQNKMIAGVCAGIARQLGVDPTLVRLAVALLGVMSVGLAFWGYIVLWMITPATPLGQPPLSRVFDGIRRMFTPAPQGAPRPEGGPQSG